MIEAYCSLGSFLDGLYTEIIQTHSLIKRKPCLQVVGKLSLTVLLRGVIGVWGFFYGLDTITMGTLLYEISLLDSFDCCYYWTASSCRDDRTVLFGYD